MADSRTEVVRLSTGTDITLPLDYRHWSMTGAVFPASLARLRALLPSWLTPIRIGPQRGAVTLFSASYDAAGPLDPYDEFAVLPLARPTAETESTPTSSFRSLPLTELQALRAFFGRPARIDAYVHTMLVTTEESRALGTDVWGYPKELADISIREDDHSRYTTVTIDDQRVLTFTVDRARTRSQEVDLYAYTEHDDQARYGRIQTHGQWSFRPFVDRASFTLGPHPQAESLRKLDLGSQPLLSVFAPDLRSRYYRGRPVSTIV